jgi:hypothetical protein
MTYLARAYYKCGRLKECKQILLKVISSVVTMTLLVSYTTRDPELAPLTWQME